MQKPVAPTREEKIHNAIAAIRANADGPIAGLDFPTPQDARSFQCDCGARAVTYSHDKPVCSACNSADQHSHETAK